MSSSENWNLFGYDLSQTASGFGNAWKEFLWAERSPVLEALDEVTEVSLDDEGTQFYRAGAPISAPANPAAVQARAVVLPARLLLEKQLKVPQAAEASLDAIIALEVTANSPFPELDTCYGWSVRERSKEGLTVLLLISSVGAVMEYIGARYDTHDVHSYEVWGVVDDRPVVLNGFGEGARRDRNQQRMKRAGAKVAVAIAALIACFAVAAGMKYLEMKKYQRIHLEARESSANAAKLRTSLSASNAIILQVNETVERLPDPYAELARLSALLDDGTWLAEFRMVGAKIRITGSSMDASAVMQQLIDHPAYADVVAKIPIKKEGASGREKFAFDFVLDGGES